VLEAVAAGLPVVVTRAVLDGLPAEIRPACVDADEPEAYADALLALLRLPPADRRARARAADLSVLTWPARFARLEAIVDSVAATPPGGPA
ncbi:MAG TPA: hypothetical protein VND92_04430, partial [Vicinamibacterales bacterium]|nr:hypothetical protein [Vicinamibacterales bacterium]